jgi:hypothetical protein
VLQQIFWAGIHHEPPSAVEPQPKSKETLHHEGREALDCVIPAWTAGIQADTDVSGRILRIWMPAIHAGMTRSIFIFIFVGERKIMNHFVVSHPFRFFRAALR